MKILILSKKFPYPLKEGEPIAIYYLSRALKALGCEISLLVMNTSKHYFDPKKLPPEENHFHQIFSVEVDNHITIKGAAKSLLKGESYILSRFESEKYRQELKRVLEKDQYDIVQLETLYMAHYIPTIREHSKAIVAMRSHNVEHEIWQRVAATHPNFFKKCYLRWQNLSLKTFELERLGQYDILVAITERDMKVLKALGYSAMSVVTPVGMDAHEYKPDYQCFEEPHSISFIGALDWMPNQYGIVWFIERVWPILSKELPNLEFHIAGKNTPRWLKEKSSGRLIIHGEVSDAKAFLNKHPVMVAPLFSGSGIKIKILEGLALGRVVVSTKIGMEGIPAIDNNHVLIADNKDDFLHKIIECFKDKNKMKQMGRHGRNFVITAFDNQEIASRVLETYKAASQKIT